MKKEFLGVLRGYYYDTADGKIYSTKARGAKPPVALTWQRGASGNMFVCLTDVTGKRVRVDYDDLDTAAFDECWFRSQSAQVSANTCTAPSSPINKKFMVGSVSTDKGLLRMSFASMPRLHNTEPEARTEAERLAKAFPEKAFIVAEVVGVVRARKVVWE